MLSVEESVKIGEGLNAFPSYEMKFFWPIHHSVFPEKVIGRLVTEKKIINMPVHPIWKMPVKGTLVKSWQTKYGVISVTGGVEGDIHAVTRGAYNQGLFTYHLETFGQEGNRKKCTDIGQYTEIRGLVYARINNMDMIVLSTYKPSSIQIRKSHDGKLIDSLPLGFNPSYNAVCITPNNNTLVCSYNGKVMEFEVRNRKIAQTGKTLNLPITITDVRGLCHITHGNRQLVIASSHRYNLITAVDYHTGDVVWKKDNPVCEGIPIIAMGITHDGAGHLFISDYSNKQICMMTPDGEIHHSLLQNTNADSFWHQAWLPDQRRFVVKDWSKGLYLCDISYDQN